MHQVEGQVRGGIGTLTTTTGEPRICCCALPALMGPQVCESCQGSQHPPYYADLPRLPRTLNGTELILEDGEYRVIDGEIFKKVDGAPPVPELDLFPWPGRWAQPYDFVPATWTSDGTSEIDISLSSH